MKLSRTLEQHIAVFGESGSGKTVMVSSFYGATQEPQFLQKSLFHVVAGDAGQHTQLHRNYLGMRDSARLPAPNRFSGTSYSFSVKLKDAPDAKTMKSRPFDALRLVWHDYPGEWFEQDVSGPEEAQHRVDTFKALLGSDVALLLVDAQRLLDNSGEEERYLKSLLSNYLSGLLLLKNDLLDDGKPLVEFPRIWIMALSKSDLMPGMDVFGFRDLLTEKAGGEMDELRKVLAGFVAAPDALSMGEDFMLLSSAKFDADKIEVTKRVGLEMILPLAAILPFERHVRWVRAKQIPKKVAENLLDGAGTLAVALIGKRVLRDTGGPVQKLVGFALSADVLNAAVQLAGNKLREKNAEGLAKQDYLKAMLTRFKLDLDRGEEQKTLLRSLR
ncbi:ATP/GTP-binding protein [Arthrobacter sp.]|uniref:ATP/GTP-binding protein n=1 Tax=Arthrobacter sp. TaxID=1667 RepID=UPI00289F2981|nr:ATP/GTP-binding protein [Arthrobacter sp.]